MTALAETRDPDGRRVELTAERWQHIVFRHPRLKPHLQDVLRAVREPTVRRPDTRSGCERFFLEGAGPERWLRVVVAFKADRAFIVTAFGQHTDP